MQPIVPPNEGPSTESEFQEGLDELIVQALDNDVDVTGAWHTFTRAGSIDIGIEIYPVERPSTNSPETEP